MKLIAAVAGKEMLHIVRDRRTLAIILVLPTVLTFIFGYAFESGALKGIPTALIDEDGASTLSLQIARDMAADETFRVVPWTQGREAALAALDRGELKGVVVLPAGLKQAAKSGSATVLATLDGIDNASAKSLDGALQKLLVEHGFRMAGLKFRDLGLDEDAARKILRPIEIEEEILYNPRTEFLPFVMPGIIGLVLQLLTVILTANAITREKERGTFTQLVATPVSRTAVLLGKLVPYALVSWVNVVTILLVARFWFGISFSPGLGKVLVLCALFIASSLSTGLLISAVCGNQTQAMQIAVFYCMPAVMLSGAYAPLDVLPDAVKAISYTFPLTYFCGAFRAVYMKHHDLSQVAPAMLVLAGFVLVTLVLAGGLVRKQEV